MDMEQQMDEALALAHRAEALGEIPVGAVVLKDGVIIGRGFNRREAEHDATAHAEMIAIRRACETLNSWRLTGCTLVVTLEPCPMCTGAILQSRIDRVIFGAFDAAAGCCGSLTALTEENFDHHPILYGGVKERECKKLMQDYFARLRHNKGE